MGCLISSAPLLTKESYRGSQAKKLGIPIVSLEYVEKCALNHQLSQPCNINDYIVLSEKEKFEKGSIKHASSKVIAEPVLLLPADVLRLVKEGVECVDWNEKEYVLVKHSSEVFTIVFLFTTTNSILCYDNLNMMRFIADRNYTTSHFRT